MVLFLLFQRSYDDTVEQHQHIIHLLPISNRMTGNILIQIPRMPYTYMISVENRVERFLSRMAGDTGEEEAPLK